MKYLLIFALTVFVVTISAQESESFDQEVLVNNYPAGLYLSLKDFIDKTPSKNLRVEARDIFKPKNRIYDSYIDNCYFYYSRTNKKVKDIFAISYEGSLFINVKAMRKQMDKKDRKQRIDYKDSFIRVVDQGKYLFLEGYFSKGGGIGLSIGAGPIGIGTGGPKEELKGIIFDFDKMLFNVIRDCKDFNQFLNTIPSQRPLQCDQKFVPPSLVREIVGELNSLP